jgi:predicted nucleic acid-binding protein
MRIVVDTDVASNLIKNTLDPAFRAELAPHEAAITFVTVGELTQWTLVRDLGARRRSELQVYIATRVKIPGGSEWAASGARSPRTPSDAGGRARSTTHGSPLAV